ncbi:MULTISPECIES: hypothetical protein [Comamonas]|uniref:hypothetical protein n=1 Tax=Comamonas TaxID=283 RepID=UPI000A71ADC7|nr:MULTISPECIES: hypothetical protein [Comamonas]
MKPIFTSYTAAKNLPPQKNEKKFQLAENTGAIATLKAYAHEMMKMRDNASVMT